jgi:hypothetical protein
MESLAASFVACGLDGRDGILRTILEMEGGEFAAGYGVEVEPTLGFNRNCVSYWEARVIRKRCDLNQCQVLQGRCWCYARCGEKILKYGCPIIFSGKEIILIGQIQHQFFYERP